jgi:hypothetical protein
MRKAVNLLVISSAAVILVTAPVSGHDSKTDSNVFIRSAAAGVYRGKVLSPRDACERRRLVRVFHDSQPRFLIGTARTDADGAWEVVGPEPPTGEKIYAAMTPHTLRNNERHRHLCAGDRSPKVTYPKR